MKTKIVRRKYAILVMLAIIMSVALVGAMGIATMWGKTNKDAVTIMNLTTKSQSSELDLVLLKIEDVVNTVTSYIGARVASTNMMKADEVEKAGLDEEIRELFHSQVDRLNGTLGYYVFYSDSYKSLVNGFAFRKVSKNSQSYYGINGRELSNLEKEAKNDWYTLVEQKTTPVWIPIRECPYTDGYIFSYAVPIYFSGKLVGAACVDVDFEVLAKPVRNISVFDNGYAYLTDDKGKVYYHPLIGYGVLLTEDEDDVPEVDKALSDTSSHGELIRYEYHGQKKVMAFQALSNNMRLVITANQEDVERETMSLSRDIVLAAAGIIALFLFLSLMLEKWTMHPVLDKMDSLAYLDGLTGTRNRTAFFEVISDLNKRIQKKEAVFGFVMFDANNLKLINDRYGHKMGDIYLLSVVEMIRECFPDYSLFRIGGDEFVVLAEGKDSLKAAEENLALTYIWQNNREKEKREHWEKPSVAAAFAAYDPQNHKTAEEVLSAADTMMYEKKQEMKRSG